MSISKQQQLQSKKDRSNWMVLLWIIIIVFLVCLSFSPKVALIVLGVTPNYIAILFAEIITAYILWLILKKILKMVNFHKIAIVCCVASLVVGYIAAYRATGYEVAMDYLTNINNQKIEKTGEEITLQEENEYKRKLSISKEFHKFLGISAIKRSWAPSLSMVFIILLFVKRAKRRQAEKEKV